MIDPIRTAEDGAAVPGRVPGDAQPRLHVVEVPLVRGQVTGGDFEPVRRPAQRQRRHVRYERAARGVDRVQVRRAVDVVDSEDRVSDSQIQRQARRCPPVRLGKVLVLQRAVRAKRSRRQPVAAEVGGGERGGHGVGLPRAGAEQGVRTHQAREPIGGPSQAVVREVELHGAEIEAGPQGQVPPLPRVDGVHLGNALRVLEAAAEAGQ